MNTETLLIAMVGIAAFAVLLQSVVLIGILIALVKTAKAASAKADQLKPLLDRSHKLLESTHSLLGRIEPRIDSVAGDLASITKSARGQVTQFSSTANDIHGRLQNQVARIDSMASLVLDGVDRAGNAVGNAVRGPARVIASALSAVKAFVDVIGRPVARAEEAAPEAEEHAVHAQAQDVAVHGTPLS